jgi:hypothetical protein
MGLSRRAIVDVFPGRAIADRARLFGALQSAFAVSFRPYVDDRDDADGVLALATGPEVRLPAELEGCRRPLFLASGRAPAAGDREEVRLLSDSEIDQRLRGITLVDQLVAASEPVERGNVVLASARSGPAWTLSSTEMPRHTVRSVLAEIEPDQVLWSMLSKRPIAFVALIQFLRSLPGSVPRDSPPLRATFMFDDPNLRRRSYGFIDYQRLVRHADDHGYHAAMAMIPLDGSRAHPAAARLFTSRPDRLSVLVHGNDHVREELRALCDPRSATAVAAQARRRIARFERRSGVRVDRVMTPPHGLCSEETTRALGAVGFDALCAEHALPWSEHLPSADVLAAWRPAEFVGGCAVIPRMPLESSAASIALRAFLDHPLVIYGHHGDLAHGPEKLAEVADIVNGLGDVRWLSMGEIAATNVEHCVLDEHMIVAPLARRIRVAPPAAVRTLTVEAPRDLLGDGRLAGWSLPGGPVTPFGEAVRCRPGGDLRIVVHGHEDVDASRIAAPPWRPWPRLRRAVVETRDRAQPIGALRTRPR